jgi:hypothetical protein
MKFTRLKFLFVLTLFSFLLSCDDDRIKIDTEAEYYIQFRMEGELKTYGIVDPGYTGCGGCACTSVPFRDVGATIAICWERDHLSAKNIRDMEWSSIEMFPRAQFSFYLGRIHYSSVNTIKQSGNFIITDVIPDGTFENKFAMYKVKGIFYCTVREDGGDSGIAITEGRFAVRFSETNVPR